MKKVFALLVLGLLFAGVATAQPKTRIVQMLNTTFSAGIDTSAAFSISAVDGVSLFVSSADSAQLAINVDYRGTGAQNWVTMTAAAGDTLITTSNTGAGKGLELRDMSATDRIPGGGQIRVRIDGVSNLGVTSPNYTVVLFAKPQ